MSVHFSSMPRVPYRMQKNETLSAKPVQFAARVYFELQREKNDVVKTIRNFHANDYKKALFLRLLNNITAHIRKPETENGFKKYDNFTFNLAANNDTVHLGLVFHDDGADCSMFSDNIPLSEGDEQFKARIESLEQEAMGVLKNRGALSAELTRFDTLWGNNG